MKISATKIFPWGIIVCLFIQLSNIDSKSKQHQVAINIMKKSNARSVIKYTQMSPPHIGLEKFKVNRQFNKRWSGWIWKIHGIYFVLLIILSFPMTINEHAIWCELQSAAGDMARWKIAASAEIYSRHAYNISSLAFIKLPISLKSLRSIWLPARKERQNNARAAISLKLHIAE